MPRREQFRLIRNGGGGCMCGEKPVTDMHVNVKMFVGYRFMRVRVCVVWKVSCSASFPCHVGS